MTTPRYDLGMFTDPGRDPDKQVNEDSAIDAETPLGHVFVVCDGMGGHVGGREASNRACRAVVDSLGSEPPVSPPRDALKRAILAANEGVCKLRVEEVGHGHPGSTIVAMLMHEGGVEIAHVGDSRIYYVHHGQVQQVTRDHSKVQLLIDIGAIRPEDAKAHPETHQIFAALGIAEHVDVDMKAPTFAYVEGDTFILCSDGLCDLVEAHEIRDVVVANPPGGAAERLVALANERGGHDNITVSVVRMLASAKTAPRSETLVEGKAGHESTEPMRTQVMASQAPPAASSQPSSSRTEIAAPVGSTPVLPDASSLGPPPTSKKRVDAVLVFALFAAVLVGGFLAYVALRSRHSHHHHHAPDSGEHHPPRGHASPVATGPTTTAAPDPGPTFIPVAPVPSDHNPFLEAAPTATTTLGDPRLPPPHAHPSSSATHRGAASASAAPHLAPPATRVIE